LKQIKRLQRQGVAIKAVAKAFHMSRNTIRKYLHFQELPRRRYYLQVNIGDFDTYIRNRLKEKPDIPLVHLFREIK
jgi:hypothetical protein